MLNQIYLTADFLATKESEQSNNIRWFIDILKRPLQQATGLNGQEFKSAISEKNGFVRSRFFDESGIQFDPSEMQFDYNAEIVSDQSISYLKEFISEQTLVIGYELSHATRTVLDRANITYIDIWLHPVRYLDDVLFAFFSNNEAINSSLKSFNMSENTYYSYADRLRVQNYRGFRRAKLDLQDNSALFVGQTLYDKAISLNGRMLSLLDFKEKFSELCSTHDHVYYSRHPFVKSGDEEVISFIQRYNNVTITEAPTYFLLASDEIKTVASISSSVVHEAKYFSKNTEFYFRPVIKIGNEEDCYSSIFQAFMFAHFWADILSPVLSVNSVEKTEYNDSKDKIRDMLSFYWGYRNIDKLESLKQTVGALYEKKNNVTPIKSIAAATDWRAAIDKASVVSFDIFDTLITRKYYFPTDVFAFAENDARKVTNGKVRNFRNNRISTETKVREAKRLLTGAQEVTTAEVYVELQRTYDLTDSERDDLLKLELAHEFQISTRRDAGWRMYKYAQKMGKEIIAVSDMTHDHQFICSLLDKSGYTGLTKVYVSSDYGLRKHEGELFDHVITDLKVGRSDVVHIGDNPHGDLKSAAEKGLNSILLPRSSVNLEKAAGYTHFIQELKSSKTEFDCILFSKIARKFYDNSATEVKPKTLFSGSAFNLGFVGMGPAITGFATWIYSQAKSAGISDIYFLSRDGLIAKKVYDTLFSDQLDAPKSHYIYASRRAARVSSIYCLADIYEIASKHIYATTIGQYLWSRFGLVEGSVIAETLQQFGFTDESHPIGAKSDKSAIQDLLTFLANDILLAAKTERENYIRYLNDNGVSASKSCALVDIGYAGSMQAALQRITGKDFLGLYFATFSTARNEALDVSSMKGYVTNLSPANGTAHGIQTHRFIYESLFCASHGSFVCIKENNSQLEPVFDDGDKDEVRDRLITQVHGGIEAFAYNLKLETSDISALKIEPESATRIFDYWLKSPTIDDALILEGLRFHDPIAPNLERFVVPMREDRAAPNIGKVCVWPEGLRAIQRLKGPSTSNAGVTNSAAPKAATSKIATTDTLQNEVGIDRKALRPTKRNLVTWLIHPIESRIILKTCSTKKVEKYIRDRKKFFEDAKKPLVRKYGRYSTPFFS
ncbi:HAD-IA family hydrolase [Pseudomonas sp. PSKL.D1]|uniref:HAD-IA family hydrolase n=1 Tax=Pseudomonas sp. PSKL.D1 TaxID=3029060 RepID=UPI0023813F58|nr:HAD-IA family hydrolase [Pseudomonas sp. PSKL.D1]WDY56679.1 HAD-IA family hydrolase [Pseudomonas sp. PSKL.D1]